MGHNLNHLRVLAALLETPNLTHVGERLFLTQSAVSKILAQLRLAFADPLLVRENQTFVLTPKALQLRANLPELLAQIDNLYQPPAFDPSQCQRRFVISSSDYVAEHIFPQIVSQIAAVAPQVALEFRLWQPNQLEQLAHSSIDLVSTIVARTPDNCRYIEQGQDQLVVLMRRDHPLLQQPLSLAHYLAASHLQISGGGDKDSLVDQALKLQGKRRHIALQVPFFTTAAVLLSNSDHLLTTPLHIAAHLAQTAPLSWTQLPIEQAPHHYRILWHQRFDSDPAHQWLRQLALPYLQGHLQRYCDIGMTQWNSRSS